MKSESESIEEFYKANNYHLEDDGSLIIGVHNGVTISVENPEALPKVRERWTEIMAEIILKTEGRKPY